MSKDIFDLYPQDEEIKKTDLQLLNLFSNVFESEDGQKILKWIYDNSGLDESPLNSDPIVMANNIGRQDLAREIKDMFNLSQKGE